ncbi:MAG: hypothetical protein JXD23_06025 [Spirochaetales bacterium]|nr:hypothetical protein [Spirochaetales bacterium]
MVEYKLLKGTCVITTKSDGTRTVKLYFKNGVDNAGKGRRIYIVRDGQTIIYIGETDTPIKTRFQRGCNAYNHYKRTDKARNGYKGYKWLDPRLNPSNVLGIHVIIFNDHDINRNIIESIESELTYLARQKSHAWPKFQNEIHFHNTEGSRETAEIIFEQVESEIDGRE